MRIVSRHLSDRRDRDSQDQAFDSSITDLFPASSDTEETHRGLQVYHRRANPAKQSLTSANKSATIHPLRSVLRRKPAKSHLLPRRYTVTFTDNVYNLATRLHRAPATANEADNTAETPDRNGRIHLQRKPKNDNLRASAEFFPDKLIIKLHRKPKSGDLRAAATASSAETLQIRHPTPTIDIQTLDIMIETLNIASPKLLSLKSQEDEDQHCRTCSCIAKAWMAECDVCKEKFLPSGVGWVNWERAGNFCPSCTGKAFEEIAAEEDECTEGDDSDSGVALIF